MSTHRPARACAVHHHAAISGCRTDGSEVKHWLVTVAEEENKASRLIWLSSAGGCDLIQLAFQGKRLRDLGLKLVSWLVPEHIQCVFPLAVEGESCPCALTDVGLPVIRSRKGELVPVEVVDVDVALVLGETAGTFDHVHGVVMPRQGAISPGAVCQCDRRIKWLADSKECSSRCNCGDCCADHVQAVRYNKRNTMDDKIQIEKLNSAPNQIECRLTQAYVRPLQSGLRSACIVFMLSSGAK